MLTLEQWKEEVVKNDPKAKFIMETGAGETYGEPVEWVAVIGPDMQADVVGVWTADGPMCGCFRYNGSERDWVEL